MEENNKKKNKTKVVVISCIIVAVLLGIGGAHVYASTHGYGNVFFLIKYLVTGEKPEITDKNELLSDRDITLSYEPINLTENIKIQIRNIQIKDNKAKLLIGVNEKEKNNTTPLKYKVYNVSDKLICDYEGKTQEDSPSEYIEELMLNEFKNDDKILKLEIYNAKNEKLTRIKINLETREIAVEGEEEAVNKISEIELKKYLSYISGFEENFDKNDSDFRISFAIKISNLSNSKISNNGLFIASEINNTLKSIGYDEIPNNYTEDFFKEKTVNGEKYYELIYEPQIVEMETIVGEIKSITYSSDVYTVKFKFLNTSPENNMNYFDHEAEAKEATVYLKLNEDKKYSTFKVVKYEKANNSNQEEKLSEREARIVLEEKYKIIAKMWLNGANSFDTEAGKEVNNFEKTVLSYGTDNFLRQAKNKLPWGMYTKDGKYYIAEKSDGDIPYKDLKGIEDIKITDSSISAKVVIKQSTFNGSEWVEKDKKCEIEIVKKEGEWLINSFDLSGIFGNLYPGNDERNSDANNEIIIKLSPSGFAGSSLNVIEFYLNKDVYLIRYNGSGFDNSNIMAKELIATGVESIYKSTDPATYGDIFIKGGKKIESSYPWLHFEP